MGYMLQIIKTTTGNGVYIFRLITPQGLANEKIWFHYCDVIDKHIPGTQ